MNVYDKIKSEEGLELEQYICSEGHPTIGYGTKLPLTNEECELLSKYRGVEFIDKNPEKIYEKEAEILLKNRLEPTIQGLNDTKVFLKAPNNVRIVLIDMAYQMGINGLRKFKKMLKAIEEKNFGIASEELLDSRYAKQSENRANRNAELIKDV